MTPARLSLLGRAALWYARKQGCAVFPLHTVDDGRCSCGRPCGRDAGKHPRVSRGLLEASRDEAAVRAWWRQWPDANVGLATGKASGWVVIDIDTGKGGEESLTRLEAKHGALPPTAEVLTGGGGRHLYYAYPLRHVPSTVGKLGRGLDVRGDGGYVVAPPSLHLSGESYTWKDGRAIDGGSKTLPPDWLIAHICAVNGDGGGRPRAGPRPGKPPGHYLGLLRRGIVNGERDARLTSLAGRYMRRGLSYDEVVELLLCVNAQRCRPPLPENQVLKILRSVLRYHPGAGR